MEAISPVTYQPSLNTSRLYKKPVPGYRSGPCNHLRPGNADVVYENGFYPFQAEMAGMACESGYCWKVLPGGKTSNK